MHGCVTSLNKSSIIFGHLSAPSIKRPCKKSKNWVSAPGAGSDHYSISNLALCRNSVALKSVLSANDSFEILKSTENINLMGSGPSYRWKYVSSNNIGYKILETDSSWQNLLVYSHFGHNNLVSFHLWWRKIVLKLKKIYKYFVPYFSGILRKDKTSAKHLITNGFGTSRSGVSFSTIWVKVFKNEPSKICGRKPLKN